MSVKLPVVDLRRAKTERSALAQFAVDSMKEAGFVYLEGIEGYDAKRLHELCDWFFG